MRMDLGREEPTGTLDNKTRSEYRVRMRLVYGVRMTRPKHTYNSNQIPSNRKKKSFVGMSKEGGMIRYSVKDESTKKRKENDRRESSSAKKYKKKNSTELQIFEDKE